MEWMVMNMDRFFAPAVQLGHFNGDKYIPAKNCKAKIDEILRRLVQDKARWHFRRSLFMNKIISQNLLPTLTHVKEDREVLEATVKVLQELMTPVECLIPVETMGRNCEGRRIIQELESSIMLHKKMFLDTRVTKAIVDLMGSTLQDSKKVLSMSECECINHCLLLVRNLLHVSNNSLIQEQQERQRQQQQQNLNQTSEQGQHSETGIKNNKNSTSVLLEDQIMWNFFAQRFDNVLIQIFTSHQQHLWNITIVQLISLMYREQKQENIRNMINEWLDSSLSESSEDDENNTMTSSSDNVSTSDPVSDSSERLSPVNEPTKLKINKNKQASTSSTMNSEESQTNTSKTQSAADSGFCSSFQPSGSNPDSSHEEITMKVNSLQKQQSPISKSANQENEDKTDLNIVELQFKATPQKDKQTNIVLDIEMEEVRSEGGSEGDSEGSSPPHTMDDTTLQSCGRLKIDEENKLENIEQNVNLFEDSSKRKMVEVKEQKTPQENIDPGDGELTKMVQEDSYDVIQNNNHSDMSINNQFNISTCNIMETPSDTKIASPCVMQSLPQTEIIRRPPNETDADSDDKPPPQLPKLTKKNPGSGSKRSRHTMSQILSENQDNEFSNSTGSDYDEGPASKRPHHQKPLKMLSKPRPAKMVQKAIQERNVKRTKLLRHKENYSIKAKALLHHHPTPEDITNLLKEFTVDFMLKGYSNLLQGLRLQVLMPYQIDLDKSHVLWLITYFIRFAVELDLELSLLCPVLSVETVSYLVYEGVVMQEELERATHNGEANLQPHIRRLHLVVTALREFFLAFEICMKKDPVSYDSQQLLQIKEDLGQLVEVRQLFVLLIRSYKPGVLNLNYLQDLITTNHRFLTTQEAASPTLPTSNTFDIFNHVKQFCTMDIMRQYGRLLENFENNDEQVNDCIFTMMHHTVGDLRSINVLLQPQILKIFLKIWNEGFDLCVDWADLIEYVLRKCTIVRTESRKRDAIKNESEKMPFMNTGIELTDEDLDHWYSLYSVQENEADLMYKIKEVCCDDSIEEPVKKEVIQKLLARGFITSIECSKLCAEIPIEAERKSVTSVSLNSDHMQVSITDMETLSTGTQDPEDSLPAPPKKNSEEVKDNRPRSRLLMEPSKDITSGADTDCENSQPFDHEDPWDDNSNVIGFINKLKEEGLGAHVEWLQGQLLEACYAKLKILGPDLPRAEPVASHFTISNQSIPLIPWCSDQEIVLSNPWFRQLLGELGFHQPNDTGKIFPRIPHFWTPDVLFLMAKRLGDIDSRSLKVSSEKLKHFFCEMRTLSMTGVVNQESENIIMEKGSACLEFSDHSESSGEQISLCSMENNRSTYSCSSSTSLERDKILHQLPMIHIDNAVHDAHYLCSSSIEDSPTMLAAAQPPSCHVAASKATAGDTTAVQTAEAVVVPCSKSISQETMFPFTPVLGPCPKVPSSISTPTLQSISCSQTSVPNLSSRRFPVAPWQSSTNPEMSSGQSPTRSMVSPGASSTRNLPLSPLCVKVIVEPPSSGDDVDMKPMVKCGDENKRTEQS